VTRPSIHLIDDPDPNAFVTGTDPAKAHLAVTTGLLALLDRDELQGVVAHEMGHVKNLDMQLMTLVAGLAGAIALIADGLGRSLRHGPRLVGAGGGGGRRNGKGGNPLIPVLLVLWLVSWLLAPLITRLLALGISRRREYLADAMAAQFTRDPVSLASALDKIEREGAPTPSIKGGVAHLCIADPLGRRVSARSGRIADLLATHPPMSIRIARLRAMGFQAGKKLGDLPPE
jgi:heat shock protein HtpX